MTGTETLTITHIEFTTTKPQEVEASPIDQPLKASGDPIEQSMPTMKPIETTPVLE